MSALDELISQKPTTFEQAKGDTITELIDLGRFQNPNSPFFKTELREVPAVVPGEGVGFSTTFKLGFVEDVPTKMRMLAKARFPDDPQAIERFGVIGGNIVFVNEDGNTWNAAPWELDSRR